MMMLMMMMMVIVMMMVMTMTMTMTMMMTDGPTPVRFLLFDYKTPVVQANRSNINDCLAGQLEAAKATCKEREHKYISSMACLIDVCFGGKGFAAEG